jgi:hypothetical protein
VVGCGWRGLVADWADVPEGALSPGPDGSGEPGWALYPDQALGARLRHRDPAHVPFGQPLRGGRDHQLLGEPGILQAYLGVVTLQHHPESVLVRQVGEVKADHHPVGGELVPVHQPGHRPQYDVGVQLLRCHVQPLGTPVAEGEADLHQLLTRGRQMIGGPPPCRVGPSFHDPVAGQAGQALGQHRLGDSRRALADLGEGGTAQKQVADDQGRPALGEDLGSAGDRTVLLVVLHGS